MLRLSAFADEISPNLDEQIAVCRENSVTHFELRGVNNKNVMDFEPALRAEIRSKLGDNGMGVISIGSPVGKIKTNDPWQPHFDRFKLAVDFAAYFEAPFIRIFSYYPPDKGEDIKKHREEVLRRMRAKVDYIASHDVVLVHENEKGIYGEHGTECLDLMQSIKSPKLRTAFDFANFVEAGDKVSDNWKLLKPYTVHIHVKDCRRSDGKMVPAGEGDGEIGPILKDAYASGYRGFLTMEPHLSQGGQFSGFTGPTLFKVAVDALKNVCKANGVPLAGA